MKRIHHLLQYKTEARHKGITDVLTKYPDTRQYDTYMMFMRDGIELPLTFSRPLMWTPYGPYEQLIDIE